MRITVNQARTFARAMHENAARDFENFLKADEVGVALVVYPEGCKVYRQKKEGAKRAQFFLRGYANGRLPTDVYMAMARLTTLPKVRRAFKETPLWRLYVGGQPYWTASWESVRLKRKWLKNMGYKGPVTWERVS